MPRTIVLVHHADAVAPDVDHMRPLSSVGLARADSLARRLAARGVKPAAVWHSGKLRARQTAEACWRACNPLASFTAVRGVQPEDEVETITQALEAEPDDVLVAGHMPHLPRLLHRLLTGRRDGGAVAFPLHGAVGLQREGERWVEAWREESDR
jgi:phosphohistidine phosphatase